MGDILSGIENWVQIVWKGFKLECQAWATNMWRGRINWHQESSSECSDSLIFEAFPLLSWLLSFSIMCIGSVLHWTIFAQVCGKEQLQVLIIFCISFSSDVILRWHFKYIWPLMFPLMRPWLRTQCCKLPCTVQSLACNQWLICIFGPEILPIQKEYLNCNSS